MEGQHLWALDKNYVICYQEISKIGFNFNAKAWKKLKHLDRLKQLSCGGNDGMHIWGVGFNDSVYYMNGN